MGNNPYLIESPALISFSGGRTSGYMLWHILEAFGGKLPKDIRVAFANTGKELEETLVFVRECGLRWGVEIQWLEYRRICNFDGEPDNSYVAVDFDSASRNGEPFQALIESKPFLPNKVMRFCTQDLKARIMKKWMVDQGYEHWKVAVGIRADEPDRLSRSQDRERYTKIYPLADAGACVENVMTFWEAQLFDLGLRQDQGNCDLCFLKGKKKLARLVTENPRLAGWWIEQETRTKTRSASPTLGQFRTRQSYAELLEFTQGGPMFKDGAEYAFEDEAIEDCHCTD